MPVDSEKFHASSQIWLGCWRLCVLACLLFFLMLLCVCLRVRMRLRLCVCVCLPLCFSSLKERGWGVYFSVSLCLSVSVSVSGSFSPSHCSHATSATIQHLSLPRILRLHLVSVDCHRY